MAQNATHGPVMMNIVKLIRTTGDVQLTNNGQAKALHPPTAGKLRLIIQCLAVRVCGVGNELNHGHIDKLIFKCSNAQCHVTQSVKVTVRAAPMDACLELIAAKAQDPVQSA